MAYVNKGDPLKYISLQPGWTIEDDGFGLLTCRATYVVSHDAAYTSGGQAAVAMAPKRGDYFDNDPRLICHRASSSINKNNLQVITADYVGIASGNKTGVQVTGRGATTTEPITRHPAFVSVIGGNPTTPKNGAVFNTENIFTGFGDTSNKKYGLKSYYSPTFSITSTFYTSDITVAGKLKDRQCCSSARGTFADVNLLSDFSALAPSWGTSVPYWMAKDESPQLLLTNVSIEPYGALFKVTCDILVAVDGLDTDVYPYEHLGRPSRT